MEEEEEPHSFESNFASLFPLPTTPSPTHPNPQKKKKKIYPNFEMLSSNKSNNSSSSSHNRKIFVAAKPVSLDSSDPELLASRSKPTSTLVSSLSSFSKYFLEGFRSDASHSLRVLLISFLIATLVMISLLKDRGNMKDEGEDQHEHDHVQLYEIHTSSPAMTFNYTMLFSIAISVMILFDLFFAFFIFRKFDASISNYMVEFCRRYVMYILLIPNILIFFQVLPSSVVDLVFFYQYLSLYFITLFRMYTLSTAERKVTFQALSSVFYSITISAGFAFLYKLSLHDLIHGLEVYKALYQVFLLLSIALGGWKVKKWFQLHVHLQRILRPQHQPGTSKPLPFTLLMASFCIISILAIANMVTYQHEMVFFSLYIDSYIAIECFYIFLLLIWNSYRNLAVVQAEHTFQNSLEYNRKMTRSISHEIRTPLNTAFLALELMISTLMATPSIEEHDASSSKQRNELLEIAYNIREGCDISLGILNQLLTFEKLSAGMMQLERKALNIQQMLDSNMKLFKMQAQQSGINFRFDDGLMDTRKCKVYIDEHKMNQVLRNLLSNAMKFTPKGGVVEIRLQHLFEDDREVKIAKFQLSERDVVLNASSKSTTMILSSLWSSQKTQREGRGSSRKTTKSTSNPSTVIPAPIHSEIHGLRNMGTLLLCVMDSGPGVGIEDQHKLFQEYVQINPGALQKGQGTGLGLCISKSIIQMHGGNIGMYSEGLGKGSTFFIELPCYVDVHLDDEESRSSNSKKSSIRSLFSVNLTLSSSRVRPGFPPRASSHSKMTSSLHLIHAEENESESDRSKSDRSSKSKDKEDNNHIEEGGGKGGKEEDIKPENEQKTELDHHHHHHHHQTPSPKHQEVNTIIKQESPSTMSSKEVLASLSNLNAKLSSSTPEKLIKQKIFKILIVDDSTPNRKMLRKLLMREGHQVFEADDGDVGLECVIKSLQKSNPQNEDTMKNLVPFDSNPHHPLPPLPQRTASEDTVVIGSDVLTYDFVLMDYFMVKMNGPEAARLMRKHGYKGPIIGVTGVISDDSSEFIQSGVDTVLTKPVTAQSIWKALKAINYL